jgi:hypothetical protein
LLAAAVVLVRRANPNEYSWLRMLDLEQNFNYSQQSVPEQMSNIFYRDGRQFE